MRRRKYVYSDHVLCAGDTGERAPSLISQGALSIQQEMCADIKQIITHLFTSVRRLGLWET